MSSYEEFADECKQAAKGLRRIEKGLRKDISTEVKSEVAVPLAGKIANAATGPWAQALAVGTKARASADPTIVVGGSKKVLSHGGSARNVVYGTEFGGGGRRSIVRSRRGRLFSKRTTEQFRNNRRPFVFPTIGKNSEWVLDKFADIVNKVFDKENF